MPLLHFPVPLMFTLLLSLLHRLDADGIAASGKRMQFECALVSDGLGRYFVTSLAVNGIGIGSFGIDGRGVLASRVKERQCDLAVTVGSAGCGTYIPLVAVLVLTSHGHVVHRLCFEVH